jgi:multiple sugar transport system ATP-binding protein
MASVELRHISKRFDNGAEAVKDFSLSIADGELVVLVGSSGCGKSTLLRMLSGLESVTEGEILIDGKVVNQATPQQRNVAMVFQNYALYPHMTVRANLEFPLKMSHTPAPRIKARVEEIADILQLTELMDRKPKQLSGGQRQRVAMGRALVRSPSVFLLDEPLSNLDARLRAHIRAEIAQIQKRLKTTTLYVTHDQVEAMTLGDRVVVLEHGEAQQVGSPQQLYDRPQNVFVARFIGSPGMNILPTQLVDKGDGVLGIELGAQQIVFPVAGPRYSKLKQYIGQDVRVGLRPEAFGSSQTATSIGVETGVEAVEFLGHETLAYLSLPGGEQMRNGQQLIARLPGRLERRGGEKAIFYTEPDALYFFDQTGRNILN